MADETFLKTWLHNGQIVVYRFINTGSEASEKWYNDVVDLFYGWDDKKPLLLLIDLSQPNNFLSAEALKRAREVSQVRPDVPGKTALVIDSSAPAHNVKALVDRVLADTRARQIFDNEDEAVAWLLAE